MAESLLLELHRRGIRLKLTDGRLAVIAPAGSMTEQLRAELREHRDQLIGLLSRTVAGEYLPEVVGRPAERHDPFPLTDIQHAYWVGRSPAVTLGGVATHFYLELEREGLDPQRLNESLRAVIDRHDMLRAIIRPDGRQQVLADVPAYQIAVADLRGLPPGEPAARVDQIRAELAAEVRPADQWPLFEIRVSLLDRGMVRLHISLDLLIADAFSMYLLFRDWRRFYQHPDQTLTEPALSYRDYVLAEESARRSPAHERAEKYWLDRMDSLPPAPALPLAVQPEQLARPEFTRRRGNLPPARWAAVKQRAHQHGLTPSAVLATAFADVLRLWSAQDRFTLNLSLFNRPPVHPEIDQVVGDFTSVTLLAVDGGPGRTFAVRAEQVQRQLLRDLEHLSYSGVRVQRERARRLGDGPAAAMPVVFTSALALAPTDAADDLGRDDDGGSDETGDDHSFFGGTGFFGEFCYGISQTPQVWLDHQVAEEQGTLYFNWDAVEALFPAGLLDDMFTAYCDLIERLSLDETCWDGTASPVPLPAWQAAERNAANDTGTQLPDRTLPELVTAQTDRTPDAVAVIDEAGEHTYRELAGLSNRLARRLIALGVSRGTLVGVVLAKGIEEAAAVLAITRAGAAYLPVDPEWPAARRSQVLTQGGVQVVVTGGALTGRADWPAGVRLLTFADPEVCDGDPSALPDVPAPGDLAYVIFTSGSTGRPKGVMIDHRSAANTLQDLGARFGVGPHDRVLALSSLSFDLSVYDIFGTLALGGAVVMPSAAGRHDPAHWNDLIRRHGVTIWNSVPALMQLWLDSPGSGPGSPEGRGSAERVPTLRLAMLSGDWIPVTLPDAVRARCPAAEVISLGGATEASIWSIWFPVVGPVPAEWKSIPYGKPLANQTMHVLDQQLEPVPVWTVGEIHIGGVGLARGYWADLATTAERFVVRPGSGERLYRTGDLGRYLPGGDIEFLGRTDNQVKLNGYRIELAEIVAALKRQPGVREALVQVDTNPSTGRRQLIAYLLPEEPAEDQAAVLPDGPATGVMADPAVGDPAVHDPAVQSGWEQLVRAGRIERQQASAGRSAELDVYRGLLDAMNDLTVTVIARTLAQLTAFTVPGDRADAEQLVHRYGLKPRYVGLVARWLELLAKQGVLEPAGEVGQYGCEALLDEAALDARITAGLAALPRHGSHRVLAGYFAACAGSQVQLLRGEVNVLEFLLPGGSWDVTDAMYADNPLVQVYNRVVARLVAGFVAQSPDAGVITVLELGAGTGATSAQVLPELPAERSHYRFTDVSTFFTERARLRFAGYPFVEYGVLDINDLQPAPGPTAAARIVIAANVLHNAGDLGRTLRRLRALMDPAGLLVLIENTVNEAFHTVTVGFYQDFGNYQDGRLLPLLSREQWRTELTAAGFSLVQAVPGDEADGLGQHVLVAAVSSSRAAASSASSVSVSVSGTSGARPGFDPNALRAAVADLLPGYMVPQHYLLLDRTPLSANGKIDPSALPKPWDAGPVTSVGPSAGLQQDLFGIWRDILARNDFGIADNFFELGGDSLHAVRIIGRMRDELGVAVNSEEGLQLLFDFPTIAELAVALAPARET